LELSCENFEKCLILIKDEDKNKYQEITEEKNEIELLLIEEKKRIIEFQKRLELEESNNEKLNNQNS
jgi:hypothetical protein